MLELGKARRALLAKQFSDIANLAIAALVFGQFIRDQQFSVKGFFAGAALWVMFAAMALRLPKKEIRELGFPQHAGEFPDRLLHHLWNRGDLRHRDADPGPSRRSPKAPSTRIRDEG